MLARWLKVHASYKPGEADRFILLPAVHRLGTSEPYQEATAAEWEPPSAQFPWDVPTIENSGGGGMSTSSDRSGNDLVMASHHHVRCLGALQNGPWVDVSRCVMHMHHYPPDVYIPRKQYVVGVLACLHACVRACVRAYVLSRACVRTSDQANNKPTFVRRCACYVCTCLRSYSSLVRTVLYYAADRRCSPSLSPVYVPWYTSWYVLTNPACVWVGSGRSV